MAMDLMVYFDIRLLPPKAVTDAPANSNPFSKTSHPSLDEVHFEPSIDHLVVFGNRKSYVR